MNTEQNNLERLKEQNPFSVPQGYMEGLTAQIMDNLPEKPRVVEQPTTLIERIRPWLYMAAVFAGLGLFFKAIIGEQPIDKNSPQQMSAQTELPAATTQPKEAAEELESQEFFEYLEEQYTDYWLAQAITNSEIN